MIEIKDDWVLGTGPANAQLMIVGEAPGKYEEELRKPFVGPSGEILTELLEVAGISRSQTYVTNVVKVRPPDNDLERLELKGYKVEDFLPLLWNEIDALRPNCILAVGSFACKMLTGKEGILNWRGSILPCNAYQIKTIPTIHPAALMHQATGNVKKQQAMFNWKQKFHIQLDIIKAVRESKFPEFNIPQRSIEIIRSSLQLQRFFDLYPNHDTVYVDTEVFKAGIVCIGFAFTPEHACSIPLLDLQTNENMQGIPMHEMSEIWRIVDWALRHYKVGGQNFKADKVYWLEPVGFKIPKFAIDSMFKFHTLSPELPKKLAFQASVLTNEPFYKNEGREYNPYKENFDNLLRYNGRDCAVNCECDLEMNKALDQLGLREFYEQFVMALYPIYEGIEKRGIKLDLEKKKELNIFYEKQLEIVNAKRLELLKEFDCNEDINYNSWKQVSRLIYELLRCPRRKDTADDTLTALANNAVKDKRKKEIIFSILDSRSIYKLKEVYCDFKEDLDGRARCTYNQVGTETGRTSTSIIKSPLRNGKWGVPFQTIPRPDEFGGRIREMFIPDRGCTFIEFDQAQAEARIVALLAKDYDLLKLFNILDIHKLTAAFCYGIAGTWSGSGLIKRALEIGNNPSAIAREFSFLDQVDDFQRQIGKNSRHGLGYDLGEEGLAIKMKISAYRAKLTVQKVHEMSPNIRGVFHHDIQEALNDNNNVLITPFGRRREFFQRWGKELFREAYAHYPQSTIGDNTKRCMLNMQKAGLLEWVQIMAEMHDGFLAQVPTGREQEAYEKIKSIFEEPIDFSKGTLKRDPIVVPVDCKIGDSWGQMKKYHGNNIS